MIEHRPWIGTRYEDGVRRQRLAIVGYSHWLSERDQDTSEGTINCIRAVISGEIRIPFFTQIRSYFGYEHDDTFWERVLFFNYLPCCVGGPDERFGHGTTEQIELAKSRFLSILERNKPSKVIVFTSRHWAFPIEDTARMNPFAKFIRGKCPGSACNMPVFLLRHPQGASSELMSTAVNHILTLPCGLPKGTN